MEYPLALHTHQVTHFAGNSTPAYHPRFVGYLDARLAARRSQRAPRAWWQDLGLVDMLYAEFAAPLIAAVLAWKDGASPEYVATEYGFSVTTIREQARRMARASDRLQQFD